MWKWVLFSISITLSQVEFSQGMNAQNCNFHHIPAHSDRAIQRQLCLLGLFKTWPVQICEIAEQSRFRY
ncbi:hypothetical protein BGV66_19860 [Burkholderia ubonensis]|uniref:Secreted protein n=1 Tax=Burkholderia ubonensis TaxID=101571 RepID=A0ABD6Q0V5_9BURK|nr:hypothetical protein BGV66_19860 [Burkholderia ubonensis]